jgi:hypothetical protein
VTIEDVGMTEAAVTMRVVAVNTHPFENGGPSRGFVPFTAFGSTRSRKRSSRWKSESDKMGVRVVAETFTGSPSRSPTRSSASRAIPTSKRAQRSDSNGSREGLASRLRRLVERVAAGAAALCGRIVDRETRLLQRVDEVDGRL